MSLKDEIVKKVESYFTSEEWNYEFDEGSGAFRAGASIPCKLKNTRLLIICRDNGIMARMSISIGTDDENEIQVMEFITRANHGLTYGSFQMDLDNNAIEYVIYMPCEDVPSESAIHRMITTGIFMLQKYGDALLSVMFGMRNAKDAVEEAERRE
jgi:hypothetical protein